MSQVRVEKSVRVTQTAMQRVDRAPATSGVRVTSSLVAAVAAVVVIAMGCGSPPAVERPAPEVTYDTTLGVGDVFEVRVFGEETLSQTYQVASDGSIDFPLIGSVAVVGRDPTEVARIVRDGLRDGGFLVSPQVSVFVEAYNSKRISVLGAVSSPGNFEMQSGLTVVQAIGLAGGFTDLANRDGTFVTRRVDGRLQRVAVHIDRVTSGDEEDLAVRPRDIIYVPERVF